MLDCRATADTKGMLFSQTSNDNTGVSEENTPAEKNTRGHINLNKKRKTEAGEEFLPLRPISI